MSKQSLLGLTMVETAAKDDAREICRLDLETPLGVVHLAGFAQKPEHRSVIFGIMSEYLGRPVTAADLVESKENPRPTFPKFDFDINWTHSDGYCVLAYGERHSLSRFRLGVDLERFSHKRLHLADRFFSAEEATLIASMDGDCAEVEFFRLWCRKEAFFKCVGGEFFEGSLRRCMIKNPLHWDASDRLIHFMDLEGLAIGAPMKSALCIAVAEAAVH